MRSLYNILRFILSHPLASKNKIEALRRFFLYQLGKLFNPYPIVYPYTPRTKLIIERGMNGATGNIYCGLHEFEDMAFLLHFLRQEDLFVDVGANIGSYTVLASGEVGAKSLTFEPVRTTYDRLMNNITINHIDDKVKAYNMGIGARKDVLRFTSNLDSVNHVAIEGEDETYFEVQVNSLDNILGDQCPSLIKIDVEGFEKEVIAGAKGLLERNELKALIIELNGSGKRYGYNDDDIHQELLNRKYKSYSYNPYTRILTELQMFGNTNTIYIKDLAFVNSRIQKAAQLQMLGIHF